jgi:bile acid:Na+ symporter, BASS family
MLFRCILNRSNIIFLLALLAGAFLPQAKEIGHVLVLLSLMIILTVTLLRFPRGFFRHPASHIAGAIWGSVMNYLVLGNLIILPALFLIRDQNLWIGIVSIAAIPPAIAIIPMAKKLQADQTLTFAGLAGAHLGTLLIAPVIGVAFFKYIPLNFDKLILLIVGLILLPLVLSRIAVDRDWDAIIERYEGLVTDCCFFIIFYTLTANNLHRILENPLEIFFISLIAVLSIVLINLVAWLIGKWYPVRKDKVQSLVLLATMKNYGLAGGIALYIFNKDAALPALVFSFFMFLYTIVLNFRAIKISRSANTKPTEST